METGVQMVHTDTPMLEAARLFASSGADALAVLSERADESDAVDNESRFVGILRAVDMVRYVMQQADKKEVVKFEWAAKWKEKEPIISEQQNNIKHITIIRTRKSFNFRLFKHFTVNPKISRNSHVQIQRFFARTHRTKSITNNVIHFVLYDPRHYARRAPSERLLV